MRFEEKFSELQINMIDICLEYCEHKVDIIYIHIIYEYNSIFTNFFFNINGKMYKKGMIDNDKVSLSRQKEVLSIITKNFKEIINLCQYSNKVIPNEIKLTYHVNDKKLKINYNYDNVTNDKETAINITEKWYEEMKNNEK